MYIIRYQIHQVTSINRTLRDVFYTFSSVIPGRIQADITYLWGGMASPTNQVQRLSWAAKQAQSRRVNILQMKGQEIKSNQIKKEIQIAGHKATEGNFYLSTCR